MQSNDTLPRPSSSIIAEIAVINEMNKQELILYWKNLFGEKPTITSSALLKRRIAHQLQINGLNADHKKIHEQNTKKLNKLLAKKETNVKSKLELEPGTVLTRFYDGEEHVVTITLENELIYNGMPYSSLSAIAREITGTRWSGPVFFGLNKKKGTK